MDLYNFISLNLDILLNLFTIFIINIIFLFFLIKNSYILSNFSNKKLKKNIQNIHVGEISRLGGLIIVIGTISSSFFYYNQPDLNFFIYIIMFSSSCFFSIIRGPNSKY